MKNRFNLNPAALLTGILTGIWGFLWVVLSVVLDEEKLNIVNSIHPWMIFAVVTALTAVIHFAISKLFPRKQFKDIPMRKLKLQAQLLMLILAFDIIWADALGINFCWSLEMGLLAVLELVIVMDNNSRGFTGNHISPVTVITVGGIGILGVLIKLFIDPIGKALLFVSLKLKVVVEYVFTIFSKVILFLSTHFKIRSVANYSENVSIESAFEESTNNDSVKASYNLLEYVIYAIIGLMVLACVIAMLVLLIEKIRSLWRNRIETLYLSRSDSVKTDFFKSVMITIKMIYNRINAVIILKRHKKSVGFAMFSLEKKYMANRNLRRQKGETPDEFIDRIICSLKEEYADTSSQAGIYKSDLDHTDILSDKAQQSRIDSLIILKQYAMRAAYDKDFSWLTELPE